MPDIEKLTKPEIIALYTEANARLAALESAFDPLALLTPDAVEGIKPLLRVVQDGLRDVPFLSSSQVKQARHTAQWLAQILSHVSGSEG